MRNLKWDKVTETKLVRIYDSYNNCCKETGIWASVNQIAFYAIMTNHEVFDLMEGLVIAGEFAKIEDCSGGSRYCHRGHYEYLGYANLHNNENDE